MLTPKNANSPVELGEITDDALTGDFRVWQRLHGHRYSVDDLVTADVAASSVSSIKTHCDLGCGLGSVLLMVAWRFPDAVHYGVEAQDISFELVTRNVQRNALDARITLVHSDFREWDSGALNGTFDLVTGTPPYVPPGSSTPAPDSQKAYARVEYRGGIEAYLLKASELVSEQGTVVVCGDARFPERAFEGAQAAGLHVYHQLDAVPRRGKPPLFSVWTFGKTARAFEHDGSYIARTETGERTEASFAIRERFGLKEKRPQAG